MISPPEVNAITLNGVEFVKTDRTYGSYTSYDESVTFSNGETSIKLTFIGSARSTIYITFNRNCRSVFEQKYINHPRKDDAESLAQEAYLDMLSLFCDMYEIVKSLGD